MKIFSIQVVLFSYLMLLGCTQTDNATVNDKQKQDVFKSEIEDLKKTTPPTNRELVNDEWNNNVYRNTFYKFRVEFPKDWEYDRGTAKMTLARALNREYGAVISVGVKNLPDLSKNSSNILEHYSKEEYKDMFTKLSALQNTQIENFKLEQGFLNNFPAYIVEYTTNQLSGTESYINLTKQIQSDFEGKIYQLTLNIPLQLYGVDIEKYWKEVVGGFKFELVY